MANILDVIKKELEPTDQVQNQYRALYDRKEGFLVLTNNRLVFLQQRGFFRANYHIALEIPYEKINRITTTASHALELVIEDIKYNITALGDINAQAIVDEIKTLAS